MNYTSLILKYFSAFSIKNIEIISELFSEDIVLIDWNIHEIGKENVIKANRDIFNSVEEIKVIPIMFYSNSETSFAVQIEIQINKGQIIRVIDLIEFDINSKIKKIVAYINQ